MKKISTLLIAMAISISLYAYNGQGKLSITSTGNGNIRVMVDGTKYKAGNNTVMISNMDEGYHTIKVFQLRAGRGGFNGNMAYGYQVVYSSRVYIKPQFFVDIVINRFGKAFVDEQPIGAGYYDDTDDDWGDDGNNRGGYNNQDNDRENNQGMSAETFSQFKQTLGKESFDNTKLTIAKQVIAMNYLTSAQVKEVMQQFDYETSKLDIAKYAYKYTVDKGSYFIVNDAFTYSNSKDELMQYIQNNK
jgi:hypothetical protein